MKPKKILSLLPVLLITILVNSSNVFSTTHNVSASDFSFSPVNLNVTVGDTVKWTRINGSHTTTCNGTNGSTRPSGATAWDAALNAGSPVFVYVITVPGMYHYVCTPHAPSMAGNINAIESSISQLTELVNSFELSQNYPNPFNPTTNINFSIPNTSEVTLKIYNDLGQELITLVNGNLNSGSYKVDWNAAEYTSGIYYYKIQAGEFVQTRKMLLIK